MFNTKKIVKATGATVLGPKEDIYFSSICQSSKQIKKGDLFIAIVGKKFDGHQFLKQAFDRGAAAAIVQTGKFDSQQFPRNLLFEVSDTVEALGGLAKFLRSEFPIPLLGITGSNGKTTTKDLISHVLSTKFNVLKTQGNFNNLIGMPFSLFAVNKEHQFAVIEMGMSLDFEIKKLAQIALPSSGLITNIGHTHLETMKTKEDILDAKAELLKSLSGEGVAFINLDDPLVKTLKDSLTCKVVTYSFLDETADFFAKIVEECGIAGQRIQCRFKTDTVDFLFPLSGQHNATNALAAFCVATHYKVSAKDLKSSFESFKPSAGRSETVRINAEITVLNDSYNANPDSMIAALKMLKNSAKTQPTYAVLGDMLELGEDDIKYHRQVGDIIKQLSVDYVLTYGGLSAYYGKIAAENKRINVFSTDNQKELIEQLKQWLKARPGLVLIKGSRGMKMELVLHALQKAFG